MSIPIMINVERIRGGNRRDLKQWELSHTTYKGMTSPSTQNLKASDLRVFFLICCSIFSFLPNVGLRLALEYLTISPSSVSPSSTILIHSPSNGSILNMNTLLITPYLYCRSHTYTGHACLKSPSGRLLIQGQTVLAQAANQRLWYQLLGESEGKTGEISNNENWATPHIREWHHLQPKTLRH